MRRAMLIDPRRCVGCLACLSACKQQWGSGPGAARGWLRTLEGGTRATGLRLTFYPGLCMQCADHPCTRDCPTGATYMNDMGVVVVDPDVCIGCGSCLSGCPYGARHTDPVKGIVEKCNLCTPLQARGEPPACVATCLARCRTHGDLDDPGSELVKEIRRTGARPLTTAEVSVGPRVHFAGEAERAAIVASGAIRQPERSTFARAWTGAFVPLARYGVPAVAAATLTAGGVVNVLARRAEKIREREGRPAAPPLPVARPATLERHRAGMRFLHWFNLLSWLVLLLSGTALISAPGWAIFGEDLPRIVAGWLGGRAALLRFHVAWGLAWAITVVPLFLIYKRGGLEALREIRLTGDDLRWLLLKPLALIGRGREPLPPQDKYNAGQKIFAITALLGSTTIIATGLIMAFHWGSAAVVRWSILVHGLAIALALGGLAVHVTMALVLRAERPALRAMVTGHIDRHHAEAHCTRWVEELESTPPPSPEGEPHA